MAGLRWRGVRPLAWACAATVSAVALLLLLMPAARTWMAPMARAVVAGLEGDAARGRPAPGSLPSNASGRVNATPAAAVGERGATYAARQFGIVSLEVSPHAQVTVNGVLVGTTPPMTQLKLPVGKQLIVLRSQGFESYGIAVFVHHEQPVELRHRFAK